MINNGFQQDVTQYDRGGTTGTVHASDGPQALGDRHGHQKTDQGPNKEVLGEIGILLEAPMASPRPYAAETVFGVLPMPRINQRSKRAPEDLLCFSLVFELAQEISAARTIESLASPMKTRAVHAQGLFLQGRG